MQKKLFLSYIVIAVLALGVSGWLFWSKGYAYINDRHNEYYLLQAKQLADVLEEAEINGTEEFEAIVDKYAQKYDIRITLIDTKGNVVADSKNNKDMENHGTREEVIQALKGESSTVTRYSKTMNQQYSYSAVPIYKENFSGVLRVSLPLSSLNDLGREFVNSILVSAIICLIVAIGIAFFFTKKIIEPIDDITEAAEKISQGDYKIKIYTRDNNQIGRMANAFNIMAANLSSNMKKLTRRKIEFEAMLSSMNSGVVAVDNNNSILFYNQVFSDMIQSDKKNLVNRHLYQEIRTAIFFQVIDSVRNTGKNVMEEGNLNVSEYNINKNVRISATPLVGENKKNLGILLVIEDISKIKKLENMRSDFVSNVTHELKTPLTSIRGFIETLKNGAIQDEKMARKFLDIIDIESERLYILIQDILLLSEIESKRDYELVENDMNACILAVIELLTPNLAEEVKIVYDADTSLRPYPSNPNRMKELFINLLDNAIKYTEKGTITIQCTSEKSDLVIRVEDTGIGMSEEHVSRIFERFYRVDKGRSRSQGGTGLGLSIVKHIVELYEGRIKVDSKVNQGTVFEIRLPY